MNKTDDFPNILHLKEWYEQTFIYKCNWYVLTILLRVFIGLVNVSLMRLAGGFLGLVEGMCTAQHLINNPINMMKAIPINNTAHQNSWNKQCYKGNR